MKHAQIVVIGGGASGMAAALSAANQGAEVLLLEAGPRVGRKLLATGNGRCNLSHTPLSPPAYHGEPGFIQAVLSALDPDAVLAFFRSLGLETEVDPEGRVYPISGLASSVLDVLRLGLARSGVEIRTDTPVASVRRKGTGFELPDCGITTERLVLSTGGLAAPKLGGGGSGYALAQSLGHRVTPLLDALSPLRADLPGLPGLKGIRTKASLTLLIDGQTVQRETGELLFTEYGLSGVCAMQLARLTSPAVQRKKDVWVQIDFLPGLPALPFLRNRKQTLREVPLCDFFIGLFHRRLGELLLRPLSKARLAEPTASLTDGELTLLANRCEALRVPITGTRGLAHAQVTSGGVDTSDVFPGTLESRLCPGLYLTGELLTGNGDCGGYNLYFAWQTGLLAGRAAAKEAL